MNKIFNFILSEWRTIIFICKKIWVMMGLKSKLSIKWLLHHKTIKIKKCCRLFYYSLSSLWRKMTKQQTRLLYWGQEFIRINAISRLTDMPKYGGAMEPTGTADLYHQTFDQKGTFKKPSSADISWSTLFCSNEDHTKHYFENKWPLTWFFTFKNQNSF